MLPSGHPPPTRKQLSALVGPLTGQHEHNPTCAAEHRSYLPDRQSMKTTTDTGNRSCV
jgi:hypothetical protein